MNYLDNFREEIIKFNTKNEIFINDIWIHNLDDVEPIKEILKRYDKKIIEEIPKHDRGWYINFISNKLEDELKYQYPFEMVKFENDEIVFTPMHPTFNTFNLLRILKHYYNKKIVSQERQIVCKIDDIFLKDE